MRRGDIVVVATRGIYTGKPRPALIVQTDLLNDFHTSLILAPFTSERRSLLLFRIPVEPTPSNGLRQPCDLALEKLFSTSRESVGRIIGTLEPETMAAVDRSLSVLFSLA